MQSGHAVHPLESVHPLKSKSTVAATTQLALPVRAASPLALWHLLSLDAPTVAALWTWFVARANHIALPLASPVAMAIAVWMLYAADRLLDSRLPAAREPGQYQTLEARHLFHHRHRAAFLTAIALAALAVAALLPYLNSSALRLYPFEGALLAVWFFILHGTRSAHRLPKEIAVGLFFSAAIFIPTAARAPALCLALLPAALLFAATCSLNCLFIYRWEHESWRHEDRPSPSPHPSTRLALAHLTSLTIAIILGAAIVAVFASTMHARLIPIAIALAAFLLLVLDRRRMRLDRTGLRAAADLVLLTPLLLLPLLA